MEQVKICEGANTVEQNGRGGKGQFRTSVHQTLRSVPERDSSRGGNPLSVLGIKFH